MKSKTYTPETVGEELMYLAGRMDAFAEYVNSCEHSVDPDTAAKMLGFERKAKNVCSDHIGGGVYAV